MGSTTVSVGEHQHLVLNNICHFN